MAQQTLNTPRETTHQRIAAALEDIVDKITDTSDADNINYNNTASGLQATKVQGAIDELASEKADKSTTLAGYGITDAYTKTESDNKYVTKETGKGLSTNDYTTADKNKLAGIEAEANKTVVDSAMSDSSTNPLQNKVITKELEGAKTTTGNPLTVTDAAPVNAVNLSVDLEPVQDLHGYDHPWVGGAGKNKLPMTVEGIKTANTSGTWNGNVYSINNGTITILTDSDNNVTGIKANGTFNANTYFYFNTPTDLPNGQYTLNGGNPNCDIVLRQYDGNLAVLNTYSTKTSLNFTLTRQTNDTLRSYCFIAQNVTLNNTVVYPMIRLSTETDSSFAPYTNICPISGRSEVAIQRVGKNLIGLGTSLNGFAGNTTFTDSATTVGFYFETKKLPDIITINAINGNRAYYSYYNEIPANGVPFEEKDQTQQTLPRTITVNKNYKYIHIQLSYNETNVTNIQVEQGTTATTYEPYAGKTYTIQLGDTIYGGQLDVTRGKMVVTHGEVDLGDLYFSRVTNATYGSYFYTILRDGKKTGNDVGGDFGICSRYPVLAVHWNQLSDKQMTLGSSFSSSATCAVVIKDDSYTNESTFNTMLRNENVQLVYELAEPFTIDLTPQQIKMLENTNTISSDGTMTLEYQPNNAIGEAVRAVEESYDPEFAVRPVLKKKAFSGTTDTDGSVTLINASDIPSGHKIIPLQITDMTIGGSAGTYFVEYEPYNSGDAVKGYCYFYMSGSQMFPVGKAITGNFYYYELEV